MFNDDEIQKTNQSKLELTICYLSSLEVVSTAAFHAKVRVSVTGLSGLKETKMFLPHPRVKLSIVGSLRDREVACSASDRQGLNFESCVWRTVSSHSSHHPQEVLLAQISLYVHKGGLRPDSFNFIFVFTWSYAIFNVPSIFLWRFPSTEATWKYCRFMARHFSKSKYQ